MASGEWRVEVAPLAIRYSLLASLRRCSQPHHALIQLARSIPRDGPECRREVDQAVAVERERGAVERRIDLGNDVVSLFLATLARPHVKGHEVLLAPVNVGAPVAGRDLAEADIGLAHA